MPTAEIPGHPAIVCLSSLFPSQYQPNAGLFVRERAFRVGRVLPMTVVSPVPWFPLQGFLRRWKPSFRPGAPRNEVQHGFDVVHPRFLSVPGLLKSLDGAAMAYASLPEMWRLRRAGRLDIIDAHFGYPDGFAAVQAGRRLGVPVTITLRGTEPRQARDPSFAPKLAWALRHADHVFTVSDSLRQVALSLGAPPERTRVVGNGVDLSKFVAIDQGQARRALGISGASHVLISVGGLVERKGFHRVIELLPALRRRFGDLHYLVVGGPSPEGDLTSELKQQVAEAGLGECVRFLGALPPEQLKLPLSAADVFVLATSNEGWANVFLEAMACGRPVVTTAVGGNAEVVCRPELGIIVPFGDAAALQGAIEQAISRRWDSLELRKYAEANTWDSRVDVIVRTFRRLHDEAVRHGGKVHASA